MNKTEIIHESGAVTTMTDQEKFYVDAIRAAMQSGFIVSESVTVDLMHEQNHYEIRLEPQTPDRLWHPTPVTPYGGFALLPLEEIREEALAAGHADFANAIPAGISSVSMPAEVIEKLDIVQRQCLNQTEARAYWLAFGWGGSSDPDGPMLGHTVDERFVSIHKTPTDPLLPCEWVGNGEPVDNATTYSWRKIKGVQTDVWHFTRNFDLTDPARIAEIVAYVREEYRRYKAAGNRLADDPRMF